MLDKLEMRTKEQFDLKIINNQFSDYQRIIKPDSIYRYCLQVVKNGKEVLTIKTNPIWQNVFQSQIKLNPTSWDSIESLNQTLSLFSNISKLEIIRIDHAVDLPLSLSYVHSGLRIKFKQNSNKYRERENYKKSQLTGYEIGTKPELYCIYDKRLQSKERKATKTNIPGDDPVTRIELRQFGKKIRHRFLPELTNYIDEPPFYNIEFLEFNQDTGTTLKAKSLENILAVDGLYNVYFNLNKKNNFKRDCLKYLTPINFQETLNSSYQENLRHYFGANR